MTFTPHPHSVDIEEGFLEELRDFESLLHEARGHTDDRLLVNNVDTSHLSQPEHHLTDTGSRHLLLCQHKQKLRSQALKHSENLNSLHGTTKK